MELAYRYCTRSAVIWSRVDRPDRDSRCCFSMSTSYGQRLDRCRSQRTNLLLLQYAPRTGEIGCRTEHSAWTRRRHVEPNQCFKLIVAFVTHRSVTNVIALREISKTRAQSLIRHILGRGTARNTIHKCGSWRSDAGRHLAFRRNWNWPSLSDCYAGALHVP